MKSFFGVFWSDVLQQVRFGRRRLLSCGILALLGASVGVALFVAFRCSWWGENRLTVATTLVFGGFFGVFLQCLSEAVLTCFLVYFVTLSGVPFCGYVATVLVGFYCGAGIAAVVACAAVLGSLYALLLLFENLVFHVLCCFLSLSGCRGKTNFRQAFCDCRSLLAAEAIWSCAKLAIIFCVLRVLTALI